MRARKSHRVALEAVRGLGEAQAAQALLQQADVLVPADELARAQELRRRRAWDAGRAGPVVVVRPHAVAHLRVRQLHGEQGTHGVSRAGADLASEAALCLLLDSIACAASMEGMPLALDRAEAATRLANEEEQKGKTVLANPMLPRPGPESRAVIDIQDSAAFKTCSSFGP